jgi:hypothetical protein
MRVANGKKIHGVVVETFAAMREYATANGLSMTNVKDMMHVLDLMDRDDHVLDSLGAIDAAVKENVDGAKGAAEPLMRMAKSFHDLGENSVDCKTHIYNLVDMIVQEEYGCESEDSSGAKCSYQGNDETGSGAQG